MGHRRVSPLGVIARYRRDRADSYAARACRAQIRTVGGSGPADAAETDVAHARIDHLRPPRRGPVAVAVAIGTEERSALDDLARHLELRLPRVVAARLTARTAGAGVGKPVARPLPDVACHVEQAVAGGRGGAYGGGAGVSRFGVAGEVAVSV